VVNARLIRGTTATINWAYYIAAGVEGWTLLMHPPRRGVKPTWALSARIVGADTFKMAQRPLLFVTIVREKRWLFPIEDFRVVGDRMTATLGPREDY